MVQCWQKKGLAGNHVAVEWFYVGFITQDPNDENRDAMLFKLPSLLSGLVMEDPSPILRV